MNEPPLDFTLRFFPKSATDSFSKSSSLKNRAAAGDEKTFFCLVDNIFVAKIYISSEYGKCKRSEECLKTFESMANSVLSQQIVLQVYIG